MEIRKILSKFFEICKNWFYKFNEVHLQFFVVFPALIIIVIMILRFFNIFTLFSNDAETARYLLSAFIQAQSAILAIVVSLTLVAVQLAAGVYSSRVFDIFTESKWFQGLLSFYILSIVYDIVILGNITGTGVESNIKILHPLLNMEMAVGLMMMALVYLPYYITSTLDLLKPENIMGHLIRNINRDTFVRNVSNPDKSIELLPAIDIIKKAIKEDDSITSRNGIKELGEFYKRVIIHRRGDDDICAEVVKHFKSTLFVIWEHASFQADKSNILEIVSTLREVSNISIESRMEDTTCQILIFLGDIGEITIEKSMSHIADEVERHIHDISTILLDKNLERPACWAMQAIRRVGINAIKQRGMDPLCKIDPLYDTIPLFAIGSLREIGLNAATKDMECLMWRTLDGLGYFIKSTPKKEVEYNLNKALPSFELIRAVIPPLGSKNELFTTQKGRKAIKFMIFSISELGTIFIISNLDTASLLKRLHNIDKVLREHELDDLIVEALNEYEDIVEKREVITTHDTLEAFKKFRKLYEGEK
ncbi:MAG: DUF2254 family protein [Candidatus Altiarchaeota archaeon]|nr:DUF2254 family protein [Candidatus Altiarchaeota archaeon]